MREYLAVEAKRITSYTTLITLIALFIVPA